MLDYVKEYADINGIKQFFLHYPCKSDTVILNVHGGPGQTEAHYAYYGKDERQKSNIVYYDQRGTGKTQLKNRTIPKDITIDALIADLKETVLYIKQKYDTEKIILVGHSWGSILALSYIMKYPDDVMCYVGTGQVVNMMANEKTAYDKLAQLINETNHSKDKKNFSQLKGYPYEFKHKNFTKALLSFRKLQGKYGLTTDFKKSKKVFYESPIFTIRDVYPLLTCLKTNKNLLNFMFIFNAYDIKDYKLPVFFICGRDDWQTPSLLVEEYYNKINAPYKNLYWVEDAGHFPLLDNPKGYNDALLKVLSAV